MVIFNGWVGDHKTLFGKNFFPKTVYFYLIILLHASKLRLIHYKDFRDFLYTLIFIALLGAVYTAAIVASSLLIKRPVDGYLPAGYVPPASASGNHYTSIKRQYQHFYKLHIIGYCQRSLKYKKGICTVLQTA